MRTYMNPTVIERLDPVWDYPLMDALLHLRGAGQNVPDPEIRQWFFPNGYGVQAVASREYLLVGMLMYDVSAGFIHEGKLFPYTEETIGLSNLPHNLFAPRERLTVEEVEQHLIAVKNFTEGSLHETG